MLRRKILQNTDLGMGAVSREDGALSFLRARQRAYNVKVAGGKSQRGGAGSARRAAAWDAWPMNDENSPYTWIVTRDAILGDTSDAVGKIGPRGARNRERFDKIIIHGDHFRLLNESGEVQFTGYILGDYTGSEPLRDYGVKNGCTRIEYERDGEWVEVRG